MKSKRYISVFERDQQLKKSVVESKPVQTKKPVQKKVIQEKKVIQKEASDSDILLRAKKFLNSRELERWADSRETSEEVAAVIMAMVGGDLKQADKVWQNPGKAIEKTVSKLARKLAKDPDEILYWAGPLQEELTESRRFKFAEAEGTHKDTIMNLADQITQYLTKHRESPSGALTDISMGLFLGFSEFYAKDGDPSTNGLNMLDKVIDKVKALSKQYEDLVPEDEADFDLDAAADEVLSGEDNEEVDPNDDIPQDDVEAEDYTDDEIVDEEDLEDETTDEKDDEKKKSSKKENYNFLNRNLKLAKSGQKSEMTESIDSMNLSRFLSDSPDVSEYQK